MSVGGAARGEIILAGMVESLKNTSLEAGTFHITGTVIFGHFLPPPPPEKKGGGFYN